MDDLKIPSAILNFFLDFSTQFLVVEGERVLYSNKRAREAFGDLKLPPDLFPDIDIRYGFLTQSYIANRKIYIQWTFSHYLNEKNINMIMCMGEDVSEIIRAKNSIERLNYIITKVPGYVFWKDKDLKLMGCNENFSRQVGLKRPDDIVGITDYDLPWEKSQTEQFLKDDLEVIRTGISKLNIEEKQRQLDGKDLFLLTSKVPLFDKEGIFRVLGIYIDVTKFKEVEQALCDAKEKAEFANQLKTDFILNMQHDIRTPICGILGMTELLIDTASHPELISSLKHIAIATKELLDYCNEVIDFANIEYCSRPILKKPFRIKELLRSITDMEKPAADLKKLNLIVDIKEIPDVISGDLYRIKRILINVVSNAIKFTNEGYVKISVRLCPNSDIKREIIINFSVEDSGIGIPEEKIDFIYEKFSKIIPSNKGLYKGSGLGLRIAKEFVEELGGEIGVKSQLNHGTIFNISLPLSIPLSPDIHDEKDLVRIFENSF